MRGYHSGQTPDHTQTHSRSFIISVDLLGDALGLFVVLFIMELLHHDLASYTSEAYFGFFVSFVIHHSLLFRAPTHVHRHIYTLSATLTVPWCP